MRTNRSSTVRIQLAPSRELQAREGLGPCYATSVVERCNQKFNWYHDCFFEAEEHLFG